MTGEYTYQSKVHSLEVRWPKPPSRINLSHRNCPKSPVVQLTIEFIYHDTRRNVLMYRVVEAQSPAESMLTPAH